MRRHTPASIVLAQARRLCIRKALDWTYEWGKRGVQAFEPWSPELQLQIAWERKAFAAGTLSWDLHLFIPVTSSKETKNTKLSGSAANRILTGGGTDVQCATKSLRTKSKANTRGWQQRRDWSVLGTWPHGRVSATWQGMSGWKLSAAWLLGFVPANDFRFGKSPTLSTSLSPRSTISTNAVPESASLDLGGPWSCPHAIYDKSFDIFGQVNLHDDSV